MYLWRTQIPRLGLNRHSPVISGENLAKPGENPGEKCGRKERKYKIRQGLKFLTVFLSLPALRLSDADNLLGHLPKSKQSRNLIVSPRPQAKPLHRVADQGRLQIHQGRGADSQGVAFGGGAMGGDIS